MEVTNNQLLARDIVSMVASGNQGGNPVISKPGIQTKTGNLAFTTIGAKYVTRNNPSELDKIPVDLIREKIKLNLMGIDQDVAQQYRE